MGEVYQGVDTLNGEPVAIKLLRAEVIGQAPGLLERFEREGTALRQLNHPNIVKMLASVDEANQHYLVMEYVGGGSLRELLHRQPQVPIRRVLEIALDLADALTRAHRLKIIHRDLKPANVLLAEDGTPRLTDFGVARMMDSPEHLTQLGSVVGTYAYLSPEACQGEELDARTDIWAFGVILFEMLTGKCPFEHEQVASILYSIINSPAPDLVALRPDIPPNLVRLIYRMLDKNRERRIGSVRQVGAELESILQTLDQPPYQTVPLIEVDKLRAQSRFSASTPSGERMHSDNTGTMTTVIETRPLTSSPWFWIMGAVAILALGLALVAVLQLMGNDNPSSDNDSDSNSETDTTQNLPPVELVAPVEPGEFMVLIAQLEPLPGTTERSVTRFIHDDLVEHLENQVPFSDIRVREYLQVVNSEEQARQVAEANRATVMVWGNYTDDFIEIKIQVGVSSTFDYLTIGQEILSRSANLTARLTDEHEQSIVPQVLGVLNVLAIADGNGYKATRIIAVENQMQVESAETTSSGVAALLQFGLAAYMEDAAAVVSAASDAISLDPGNPIPYMYRGVAYLRQGEHERALRDISTAQRLGPADWTSPMEAFGLHAILVGNIDEGLKQWGKVAELRPTDWYPLYQMCGLYYFQGNYEEAQRYCEQADVLGPDANFPYVFSMLLALRRADLIGTQQQLNIILTRYPDPTLSMRLLHATFGTETTYILAPTFSAFGNLLLGQYENVVSDTKTALVIDDQLPDLYMVQGVAYCNLRDYSAAEAAYSSAIQLDPDYTLIYALRAEVRIRQGNMVGALEDSRMVRESSLGTTLDPLFQAAVSGDWSCENMFDYDYTALAVPIE
ncbi:MAG: protein kinase [Chloroflexi bacterium]|nr:protein kinase [Chloroflexota bacterium]